MRTEARLVNEIISSWRNGASPDAVAFLEGNPTVAKCKSLVLDLVLEEYCLRKNAGEVLQRSTFSNRFGAYRETVARLLDVQEFLASNIGLAPPQGTIDWPQVGEEFHGFRLQEELGSGAFS